jgi:hypothetical protein
MKLEEITKSTEEVKKFSNGNMLLTLWFTGSDCKSMEVVFDMLSGTSVLFCTNKKSHYYDTENEVRYGYELSNVASKCKRVPQNKLETLKISVRHLNVRIRGLVDHFLQTV